jgi:hypothetical protein
VRTRLIPLLLLGLLIPRPRPVAAQIRPDRPPPPPVSILPPDGEGARTVTAQDSVAKRTTLPTLALPDIVVFGRSSATMREGSKLFTADKRTALDREIVPAGGEKSQTRTGWGGSRRTASWDAAAALRRLRAWTQAGSWGEVLAGAEGWLDRGSWQFTGTGGLERSGGHLPDSAFLLGRFEGGALHGLNRATDLRLRLYVSGGRQGEWGSAIPSDGLPGAPAGAERDWFEAGYGVELETRPAGRYRLGMSVAGRHAGLSDAVRTPGLEHHPASNGWALEATGGVTAGRVLVTLEAGHQRDHLTGPGPAQDVLLSQAAVGVNTRVGGASSLSLGGVWYHLSDDLSNRDRLWPRAEFVTRYSERLDLFIRYRPGIEYRPLGAAHRENPFVANDFRMVPREEDFHLGIGLRYLPLSGVTLGFEVARRQFDRLPVWRRAPLTDSESAGLFILGALTGVMVNETRLEVQSRLSPQIDLRSELLLRQPAGGLAEIPHLPRFALRADLEAAGPWELGFSLRLDHLGVRYGDGVGSAGRRLAAATDLGLGVQRAFGRRWLAWVALRNLLDSDMATWEGYPLPGRTSAVGISLRF